VVIKGLAARLGVLVNPEAADAQAREDQAAKIAILTKGSFGYSQVPGTKPVYN
jgi:hypothetical protein